MTISVPQDGSIHPFHVDKLGNQLRRPNPKAEAEYTFTENRDQQTNRTTDSDKKQPSRSPKCLRKVMIP